MDCSTSYDLNFGCNGGMPARALNYVKRNGLTTEIDYPYVMNYVMVKERCSRRMSKERWSL